MSTMRDASDECVQREEIRQLAEEFAQQLRNGSQPKIEEYTSRVAPPLRDRLREELIGEEFADRFGDATQNGTLRYRPVARLGSGAFGEVYRAVDEQLVRCVAIKVLLRAEDAASKQRFLAEARCQANLPKHNHVVAVYDSGILPKGHPFVVMEYVDGGTLQAKLKEDAKLDAETAARLVEQIAQAVAAVHSGTSGSRAHPKPALVHQDLKPVNILLDRMGNAHVADFGIAAEVADLHSGAARAGGTFAYMSPEQAMAFRPGWTPAPVDTRSDIWALGVILYELLTGRQPFASRVTDARDRRDAILESILRDEPPRMRDLCPDVPPELERLVGECLKKEVGERIASTGDVASRLRRWLDSVSAIPGPVDFSAWLMEARENFTDRPWLFDEVQDRLWRRNQRLVLLSGELGSGKSAFLAELIHRNPEDRILAWHLCRHGWPESLNAAKFVRSLAGMLATRVEGYRSKFAEMRVREALRIENCEQDAASAFETAVVTPLATTSPPGDGVWVVVVDALDEGDPLIARLLAQWVQRLPEWLRILASVRRAALDPSIFAGFQSLDIDRENADHFKDVCDDILQFVEDRLCQQDLSECFKRSGVAAEVIANTLLEKSEANFLYVVQALVGIERGLLTFTDLDKLPPGLTGLYAAFFGRQWPNRRSFASVQPILETLLAAQEPLHEVVIVSVTNLDTYELNERLGQLAQYLIRDSNGVRIRHLALHDWLDSSVAGIYQINVRKGDRRLADYCSDWPNMPEGPGREYARQQQILHLVRLGDRPKIGELFFKTPYLYHRLREDTTRDRSLFHLLYDLQLSFRDLEQTEQTQSLQLRSLMDFLIGWRPAILENSSLVEQWWTAAGDVTRPFLRVEAAGDVKGQCLLLPTIGPSVLDCSYPIPWPARPHFHGAVCQATDERGSRIVFAMSQPGPGDLLIYRDEGGRYVRERFIRFPSNEGVFHLAGGLSYGMVAALVRLPDGGCDLRGVNLSSGGQRTVLSDDRIITCAVIDVEASLLGFRDPQVETIPGLLLISRVPAENGPASSLLYLVDFFDDGKWLAELELPFMITNLGRIDVVPFAPNTWGIIGQPSPAQRNELVLFRLTAKDAWLSVDEFALRIEHVNGACRLPGERLAVCHRANESSFLSIIKADGEVEARIPLYTPPSRATPGQYDHYHATIGQFLLDCFPAGWHQQYGIVLCAEAPHGNQYYSVRPAPEAIPQPLPNELSSRLDTGDSTTSREGVLQLTNERLLVVFSMGGIVMEPGLTTVTRIEGGAGTEFATELLGCRADGQVVICDGYVNPDNAWSRKNERLAQPPFSQDSAPRPLHHDFHRVTPSGTEISVSHDRRTLEAIRGESPSIRWQSPEGTRIGDAEEADDGALIAAVHIDSGHRGSWLYHIHQNNLIDTEPCQLFNGDEEPRIIQFAGRLAVIERVDEWGHHVGGRFVVDLRTGRSFTFNGSNARLLPLPADQLLLLSSPSLSKFGTGPCFLFSPQGNPIWTEANGLEASPQSVVHECVQQGDQWLLTLVSITQREWQWSICTQTVRLVTDQQQLICQQSRSMRLDGEVTCWTHHGKVLVLGFASGRIEVRSLRKLDQVTAVGYTTSRPEEMIVVHRTEGSFLVVSAGALVWFPFAHS